MQGWRKIPMVRMVIPFIGGILFAIYLVLQSSNWLIFFGISTIILIALLLQKSIVKTRLYSPIYGVVLYGSLFLAGIVSVVYSTSFFLPDHYHNYKGRPDLFKVEIAKPIKEKPKSVQAIIEVTGIIEGNMLSPASGLAICYFEKCHQTVSLKTGDNLLLKNNFEKIDAPSNPHEFNYREYMRFHEIEDRAYLPLEDFIICAENDQPSIYNLADAARNALLYELEESGVEGPQLAVTAALVLGYKDKLGEELKFAYSSAGAMHVLAVSGLHVGIIFLILNTLLKFMDKSRRGVWIKAGVLIILLWIYALITGLSPSVIRAATMFSFVIMGNAMSRPTNIYNTLAASAFVLLAINPYLIMEVGFQLSYLAVLGIVYFQPKLYQKLYFKSWILDKIWAITAVSIAAQLTTFPLGLLYFHQFPTYFLISNLIVIPAATLILGLGVILFAVSPIDLLSEAVGYVLNQAVMLLNYLVSLIESLPFALFEGVSITVAECWTIYEVLIMLVLAYEKGRLKFVNYAMVLVVALLLVDLKEDFDLSQSKSFAVYNIKGESASNFMDKSHNELIADKSLYADRSAMLFHIKHNWFSKDLSKADINTSSSKNGYFCEPPFYQFGRKRVVILEDIVEIGAVPLSPIDIDWLVISKGVELSIGQLERYFNFKMLILDSTFSKYEIEKIKEQALNARCEVYVVSEQGAFEADC